MPRFKATTPLRERFDHYVRPGESDRCWLWTGYRNDKGYGLLQIRTYYKTASFQATRLAWEYANGPIPDGLYVCHRCDNPPCCNPAHLFLGTQTDNMQDAKRKGRVRRGEGKSQAKLTDDMVRAIRTSQDTEPILAKRFGVSRGAINDVRRRKTWRHV